MPAENAVIAAAHSQHQSRVMAETVRQSVDGIFSRQSNAKKTADYLPILQCVLDFLRRSFWNFSIDMEKPEHVAASPSYPCVHLHAAIRAGLYDPIAKLGSSFGCSIRARPIDHDYLCFRRTFSKVGEEIADERGFIENRDNDRNLHAGILRL